MDNYLNFPLLILRIVQQCERHGVPVKLFSVGAGKRYSWLGRKITARILRSKAVDCVVCRDGNSYNLIRDIGGVAVHQNIRCGSSEERRVGKEGVRTCISRWSPIHKKKHLHKIQ